MPHTTHDTPEIRIPSFFWHSLRYPLRDTKPPLVERTTVREVADRYRDGHAVAVRLWPTRWAIVCGWWGASHAGADVDGLTHALGGTALGVPVTQMAQWRGPNISTEDDLPEGVTLVEDHREPA